MRFKPKETPELPNGTWRVLKIFLWLPRKIHDETRWLETANIEQEYYRQFGWIDLRFID